MDYMQKVDGKRIARLRKEKGMTQAKFAEAIGRPGAAGQVSAWECNARQPRPETVRKMAEVLGVDWETLYRFTV